MNKVTKDQVKAKIVSLFEELGYDADDVRVAISETKISFQGDAKREPENEKPEE